MSNKKNPMRYFSGSTFARLPLYKLAAGGTAVVLTASIGLGAFAASVGPLSAPEPSPTPDASASPSPTPSKSAKEDDTENEKTARFGEHGSTGPGSAAKRAFGSVDNDNEANAQREIYARVRAEFGVE